MNSSEQVTAVVMLPSLQFEECVKETVQRQLRRSFARSAEREEQVIPTRLPVYLGLPGRKVETMQPVETVVTELISALGAQQAIAPDGSRARSRAPLALGVS